MKTEIPKTRYRRWHMALLTMAFFINTAHSQAYKVRMAMMGNSITYGANLPSPSTQCYPAQLSQMLSAIFGDTCEIKNYGVSATTMMRSAETPLWRTSQFKSALKYVPDICLILLGTNDSKPYRWDAWGDEFLGDYLAMIDTFKFRNPYTRFIACYPPPIWEGHPYGTTYENSHNDSIVVNCIIPLIDTVVKMTGAILIDFHTPLEDSLNLFPDKLHPNIQGSKVMAEILCNTMIEKDLIHQVETGLAFVSSFEQSVSPVPVGDSAELKWTTLFADSVFLDGIPVETNGSLKVIAEENKTVTLTAKGAKNTSVFPLQVMTYIPVKSGLEISASSTDYSTGNPVVLYAAYTDQYKKTMTEKAKDITWTVMEGEAEFGDQTDTSIVFIPVATGTVIVEASEGDLSAQLSLTINSMTFTARTFSSQDVAVFPNPVNETLCFRVEDLKNEKVQIKVFNLLGKQLYEHDYTHSGKGSSTFEMNTSALDQGLYVYAICIDNQKKFGLFVKHTE